MFLYDVRVLSSSLARRVKRTNRSSVFKPISGVAGAKRLKSTDNRKELSRSKQVFLEVSPRKKSVQVEQHVE